MRDIWSIDVDPDVGKVNIYVHGKKVLEFHDVDATVAQNTVNMMNERGIEPLGCWGSPGYRQQVDQMRKLFQA